MSTDSSEDKNHELEAQIRKLEVSDILDIYKTRILNETKQDFFVWLKSYTLIFALVAWLVSLIGVGYLVEKITEDKLESKVAELETRSEKIIEKNVERLASIDASITQVSQLAVELKTKITKRRKEFDKNSNLIRAASQDSAGQFLRYERLMANMGMKFNKLSKSISDLAIDASADSVSTDLKIFEYETQGVFNRFFTNGRTNIDLATREDSSIVIPDEIANWLADQGFVVRRYSKVSKSALKVLYGENYNSIITSSNFIMVKYSDENSEIMHKIIDKLKSDPYFRESTYDISKSNGESIGSFVSILF